MAKFLVTGGAGFIGSCFVRHMLNKYPDYKIINIDALTYAGNIENLNDIKDNSFKGKVKFNKKLTKPMIEYANKILDQPFSGTTARERIAKSTYDVEIHGRVSKRTIHPRLFFSSGFNHILPKIFN